jgi:hypothetical protein
MRNGSQRSVKYIFSQLMLLLTEKLKVFTFPRGGGGDVI